VCKPCTASRDAGGSPESLGRSEANGIRLPISASSNGHAAVMVLRQSQRAGGGAAHGRRDVPDPESIFGATNVPNSHRPCFAQRRFLCGMKASADLSDPTDRHDTVPCCLKFNRGRRAACRWP
jgi:hypothetical protein